MRFRRASFAGLVACAVCLLIAAQRASADSVVWDYSPDKGAIVSSGYGNNSASQNFAELVTFGADTTITGYRHYGDARFLQTEFTFKLLADAGGAPGGVLTTFDIDATSTSTFTTQGFDLYQADLAFSTPIELSAGVNYWVGLSGRNAEATQVGINAPGDGRMAIFFGSNFNGLVNTGDQSFQLLGHPTAPVSAVPLPSAAWAGLALLGGLGAAKLRRSRDEQAA